MRPTWQFFPGIVLIANFPNIARWDTRWVPSSSTQKFECAIFESMWTDCTFPDNCFAKCQKGYCHFLDGRTARLSNGQLDIWVLQFRCQHQHTCWKWHIWSQNYRTGNSQVNLLRIINCDVASIRYTWWQNGVYIFNYGIHLGLGSSLKVFRKWRTTMIKATYAIFKSLRKRLTWCVLFNRK